MYNVVYHEPSDKNVVQVIISSCFVWSKVRACKAPTYLPRRLQSLASSASQTTAHMCRDKLKGETRHQGVEWDREWGNVSCCSAVYVVGEVCMQGELSAGRREQWMCDFSRDTHIHHRRLTVSDLYMCTLAYLSQPR